MDLRTVIVGEGFHPGATDRRMELTAGEVLVLVREPSNLFDKNAVAVFSSDGVKLGYVPRTEAPVVAKVIDSGKEPKAQALRAGRTEIAITWEG